MKRTLLLLIFAFSLVSFTFAGTKYDKYQAVKEGGEYYNKLQAIYDSEDYQERHNTAVSECQNDLVKQKLEQDACMRSCNNRRSNVNCLMSCSVIVAKTPTQTNKLVAYEGDIRLLGTDNHDPKEMCKHPTVGMTEEETQIYLYINDTDLPSVWSIEDNKCYNSMNGYYDVNSDSCVCEEGNELKNGICSKAEVKEEIKEEVKEEKSDLAQGEDTPFLGDPVKVVSANTYLEKKGKLALLNALAEIIYKKGKNMDSVISVFKASKDEYTSSIGYSLEYRLRELNQ